MTTRWPRRSTGLYKTELIKPRKPWRSIEDVEVATAANTGPLGLDSETFGPSRA
jgi:hypothetical protein